MIQKLNFNETIFANNSKITKFIAHKKKAPYGTIRKKQEEKFYV